MPSHADRHDIRRRIDPEPRAADAEPVKRSIVGWLARRGCIHDDTKAQAPPCARPHCLQRITLQMIGPDVSLAERVEVDGLAAPRERRRHAGQSDFIDESLHPGIEPAEPHGRHGDRLGSGAREVAAIASRNRGGMPLADRRETRPNGYHRKEDGDPSEPACHGDLQICVAKHSSAGISSTLVFSQRGAPWRYDRVVKQSRWRP
jgi:hypothetical protein